MHMYKRHLIHEPHCQLLIGFGGRVAGVQWLLWVYIIQVFTGDDRIGDNDVIALQKWHLTHGTSLQKPVWLVTARHEVDIHDFMSARKR